MSKLNPRRRRAAARKAAAAIVRVNMGLALPEPTSVIVGHGANRAFAARRDTEGQQAPSFAKSHATSASHDPVAGFIKAKVIDTPAAKARRDLHQRFSEPVSVKLAPVTPAQYAALEQISHARQYFSAHLKASLRLADAAEKARKEGRQGW